MSAIEMSFSQICMMRKRNSEPLPSRLKAKRTWYDYMKKQTRLVYYIMLATWPYLGLKK